MLDVTRRGQNHCRTYKWLKEEYSERHAEQLRTNVLELVAAKLMRIPKLQHRHLRQGAFLQAGHCGGRDGGRSATVQTGFAPVRSLDFLIESFESLAV